MGALLTTQELREEVGAHAHKAASGYVDDTMLSQIIDRFRRQLEGIVVQRLEVGERTIPSHLLNEVTATVSQNGHPQILDGTLDDSYFPYSDEAYVTAPTEEAGRTLTPDSEIWATADKDPFRRYRFSLKSPQGSENIGNTVIYVLPSEVTEVQVFVTFWEDAVEEIAGTSIAETNQAIVDTTKQMIQSRRQEFARNTGNPIGPSLEDLQGD